MMDKTAAAIDRELELIRRRNGGILRAEQVVEFARNPKTALHSQFEWDDTKAGYQYRLWQAREIIRVRVTMEPRINAETRAYVSLYSDRKQPGGGYRAIADVLSDEERREELLQQALRDMEAFKHKYIQLKRLAPVFAAMDRVQAEIGKLPLEATGE